MTIKDFKIETDFSIDGVVVSFDTASASGGLVYEQSSNSFISNDGNIPVGVVRMWASGSTSPSVPDDYLICDGRQDLSQTTYARLYSVIGDRFTTTPNGSTFGLPSFNSASKQYPTIIGINSSNDSANAGVFIQTANQNTINIGSDATTSHTHTSGAGFVANATSNASLSHSHTTFSRTDNHAHFFGTGTTGSTAHSHNTSNASTSHSHTHTQGNVSFIETSGISANHTHSFGGEDSNHAHNSSTGAHSHNTTGPLGASSNTHAHSFQATLSAFSPNHSHQIDTSGFYFIIRYR
jgi:hypothetical protein